MSTLSSVSIRWIKRIVILSFFIVWISSLKANPDEMDHTEKVLVRLEHGPWLQQDMVAYIRDNSIYIPMVTLFNLLSLKISYDHRTAILKGFFLSPEHSYEMTLDSLEMQYKSTRYPIEEGDILSTNEEVFIKSDLLNRVFQLGLHFDRRNMKVRMHNQIEFPYIRRKIRKVDFHNKIRNQSKSSVMGGDITAIPSFSAIFSPGVTRWQWHSAKSINDSFYAFSLQQTGYFFGGDYHLQGRWSHNDHLNWSINGRWRKIWSDNPVINQLIVGSNVNLHDHPVHNRRYKGISITNRSLVLSKPYTQQKFTHEVKASRDLALYLDRKLFDYRTVDGAQEVNFNVPVGYGSHTLNLEIFGPHGEFRQESQYIRIPRSMVPPGKWIYSITSGRSLVPGKGISSMPLDGEFSSGYGVTDELSVLAGGNYMSEYTELNGYLRAIWNLKKRHIFNAYVTANNETGLAWDYKASRYWGFQSSFSRHNLSNWLNPDGNVGIQERWQIKADYHWSYRQATGYSLISHVLSSVDGIKQGRLGFGSTLSWGKWQLRVKPVWDYRVLQPHVQTSDFRMQSSLSYRNFHGIHLTLSSNRDQYLRRHKKTNIQLRKQIDRWGHLSVGAGWKSYNEQWTVSIDLKLKLPFLKSQSRVMALKGNWNINHRMGGSFWYDDVRRKIHTSNRGWHGQGKAFFKPFLDKNENGEKDQRERWVDSENAQLYSALNGTRKRSDKLPLFPAYSKQMKDMGSSINYLQILKKYRKLSFTTYPGIVNIVPVPAVTRGSIAGKVKQLNESKQNRSNDIKNWHLIIKNRQNTVIDTLRALPSGRFYKQSISPGSYTIQIAEKQLEQRGLESVPAEYSFTISSDLTNIFVNDLSFSLE